MIRVYVPGLNQKAIEDVGCRSPSGRAGTLVVSRLVAENWPSKIICWVRLA